MSKEKHPYDWLAKRITKLRPFVSVANNKPGGVLVFTVYSYKNGNGLIFLERDFLVCVRYIRKNPPLPEPEFVEDNAPDEFECCAECDLPDACADFGCAISQGIRAPELP